MSPQPTAHPKNQPEHGNDGHVHGQDEGGEEDGEFHGFLQMPSVHDQSPVVENGRV